MPPRHVGLHLICVLLTCAALAWSPPAAAAPPASPSNSVADAEPGFAPYGPGTMAAQAGAGALVAAAGVGLLAAVVWSTTEPDTEQRSAAGTAAAMGVLVGVPLLIPVGVNLTGMAFGGDSHYLSSMAGTFGGLLLGGMVANAIYVSDSTTSLAISATTWGAITLAGGVWGYHFAAARKARRVPRAESPQSPHAPFTVAPLVAPTLDRAGRFDGARLGVSVSF